MLCSLIGHNKLSISISILVPTLYNPQSLLNRVWEIAFSAFSCSLWTLQLGVQLSISCGADGLIANSSLRVVNNDVAGSFYSSIQQPSG